MSASREKKSRHADGQGTSAREQHSQKEAAARKNTLLYSVILGIVAVFAVLILIWNSGFIQRSATAAIVNGQEFTTADMQFYYNSTYNAMVNQYTSSIGMPPFDPNKSLKDQVYNQETGETWYDYILQNALDSLTLDTAMVAKAEAEGYQLSEYGQQTLDNIISQLDTSWAARGFSSRKDFIRANFGSYMTYDHLVELLTTRNLATDYAGSHVDELRGNEYSDDMYSTYYQENANNLDTYTYSQVIFQATVNTKDADGNPIEMTEEERTAAMEKAKADAKASAQALQARLDAGEELTQEMIDELGDAVFSSTISQKRTGTQLNSTYSEWMMDKARKSGDTTLAEYDGGTLFNYYVVRFEGRKLDESSTANVRHILVAAGDASAEPTQEQYDEAKAKAQELLDQWQAGEATEESFAALATEHSADPGSASNGGLIAGISADSGFIPEFQDWALDPSRKVGDVGLVQNTGSSVKGWHIMYYAGDGEPIWKQIAMQSFLSDDYNEWEKTVLEGYESELASGAKYI